MSQPYIRFFGVDWRSDPRLRLCSAAARGVWIDMLTLMMEATPFGHLMVNGEPATEAQLAALTCTPARVIRKATDELERNGVFSRAEGGVIFSRRMVRDAERQVKAKEDGRRGGNPKLLAGGQVNSDGLRLPLTPLDKPHGSNHSHSHSQGQKGSDPNGSGAAAPPDDPIKALWDRGLAILGDKGRGLLGKARKEHGDLAVAAAIAACEEEHPSDPAGFFVKCLAIRAKRNGGIIPNEGVF